MKDFIKINENDNVIVALRELAAGETILAGTQEVTARETDVYKRQLQRDPCLLRQLLSWNGLCEQFLYACSNGVVLTVCIEIFGKMFAAQ